MGFLIGCIGVAIIFVVLFILGVTLAVIAIYCLGVFAIIKAMEHSYYYFADKPFDMLWICSGIVAIVIMIAIQISNKNKKSE